MTSTGKILAVADDPASLARLRDLFAQSGTEGQVEYCGSRADAVAAITGQEFSVVFAELSEGAQAGLSLLQEIFNIRPQTIRFFLGRSLAPELLVQCVVNAHHFLQSPLALADLKAALERAACVNRLVRNQHLQTLVSRMRTLPSRPSLYLEVMRELRSPTASAQAIGNLVAKDLGISTKLIQVVNSAFYGLSQKVEDPASAVLLLGLETTASLVLSIEAFSRFDQVKPLYFSTDRVWKHSQAVAHSARRIAELMSNDPEVARHAFTAGLVHDIGKLAFALNFEEQYQGALKLAEKRQITPCEVEADVFGATHAEAGAYLLSLWGLPLPIVEAVAAHHEPAAKLPGEFSALTALHLAERLHSEHDQRKDGIAEPVADLAYPEELQVIPRLDEFRRIVAGREEGDTGGTIMMTRAQLKAVPVPVNVAARPAPMLTVEAEAAPKKHEKQAGIALGIVVLLLGAGAFMALRSPKQEQPYLAARERDEAAAAATGPRSFSRMVSEAPKPKLTADAAAGAKASKADPLDELKLQAIMFNGHRSAMIINGRSYRMGDQIAGATIVGVQPDQVTLERDGSQRALRLH